jgi:uncharacterized membrane protein YdjX (TVP38/TMEM64 family)
MSMLGRIHTAGVTAITVCFALLRIAVGLALLGGCVWAWANGFDFGSAAIGILLGIFGIWGLVVAVMALGVFAGAPSPERNARRETRKALRRARMMRRW